MLNLTEVYSLRVATNFKDSIMLKKMKKTRKKDLHHQKE